MQKNTRRSIFTPSFFLKISFLLLVLGGASSCGAPCSLKENADGSALLTCGDQSYTIRSGKDGAQGRSCEMKDNLDGSATIACGDQLYLIRKGQDGLNGKDGQSCNLRDNGNDSVTILCGTQEYTLPRTTDTIKGIPYTVFQQLSDGITVIRLKKDGSFSHVHDAAKDVLDLTEPFVLLFSLKVPWETVFYPKVEIKATCTTSQDCLAVGAECRNGRCSSCSANSDCPNDSYCANAECRSNLPENNPNFFILSHLSCDGATHEERNANCKTKQMEFCDEETRRCAHTDMMRKRDGFNRHRVELFYTLPYRQNLYYVQDSCNFSKLLAERNIAQPIIASYWTNFGDKAGNVEIVAQFGKIEKMEKEGRPYGAQIRYVWKSKFSIANYAQKCLTLP
ncbi:hypothetical protein L6R29_05660 [Myxococcota bacterium]|nr:hypothetical protein [Myxococcota bacterium]